MGTTLWLSPETCQSCQLYVQWRRPAACLASGTAEVRYLLALDNLPGTGAKNISRVTALTTLHAGFPTPIHLFLYGF